MEAHYGLPSGDYTLHISQEELEQLVNTGKLHTFTGKMDCTTSRLCYLGNDEGMRVLDKKPVCNFLQFHLDEPVADIAEGDHYVQFLNIVVDKRDV